MPLLEDCPCTDCEERRRRRQNEDSFDAVDFWGTLTTPIIYTSSTAVSRTAASEPEADDSTEAFRCSQTGYTSPDRGRFVEHEGELIERQYFDRNYDRCAVSGKCVPHSELWNVFPDHSGRTSAYVCLEVRNSDFIHCHHTQGWFPQEGSEEIDGMWISGYAIQRRDAIQNCAHCRERHAVRWMERSVLDGLMYCPSHCPHPVIQRYNSKPNTDPIGRGPVFYGVEVEWEISTDAQQYRDDDDDDSPPTNICEAAASECLKRLNAKIEDFAIAKHDGSISHGFELVSRPASRYTQLRNWKRLFSRLPEGISNKDRGGTGTCGMHVHVSKRPLTTLRIAKMMLFVNHPKNRKFIRDVAGRNSERYSYIKSKKAREVKAENATGRYGDLTGRHDKYEALNLANDHTVEFRIFRSPLTFDDFMKNLEFCAALVEMCHKRSGVRLALSVKHERFVQYVEEHKDKFPHLSQFLNDKGWVKDEESVGEPPASADIPQLGPAVQTELLLPAAPMDIIQVIVEARRQHDIIGGSYTQILSDLLTHNDRLREGAIPQCV